LNVITVVKPETVIRWHRRGFRAYRRWKSRRRGGRPRIDREIRDLIRRMSRENPLWGAPRIHGELLMLGIEVAQSTVARYMSRRQGPRRRRRNEAAAVGANSESGVRLFTQFWDRSFTRNWVAAHRISRPRPKGYFAMAFELPNLPYSLDALKPHISAETLEYHHGKHHKAYVTKLNELVVGTKFASASLEEIVKTAEPGPLFNSAGQHWNHSFYWKSLSPKGGGEPKGPVADAIKKDFGNFDAFKKKFSELAAGHFGSGWAWLVRAKDRSLQVVATHDAGCPIRQDQTPIITCDVWEHAYYIDYRNARPKYVEAWWELVNWDFANANFK
jgi:Fe-Mn family superoxide dismutase